MRTPNRTPVVLGAALGLVVVLVLGALGWAMSRDDPSAVDAASEPTVADGTTNSLAPASTLSAGPSASVSGPVSPSASASASAGAGTKATAKAGGKTESGTATPRSRGSFPDAGSTGVPAGTALKVQTSTLRVTKAGTVISGVDMRSDISVEADHVTIKNSRLVVGGEWGIIQRDGASGLVVQDSEIRGNGKDRLQHAVFNQGGDLTIKRTEMSICSDAISTSQGLIEDNYLHDPIYFDGDHTDMIQSNSGPGNGASLVIRHNTVINTLDQTSAIALFQDFGVQHDAVIENNLLAGGGYALYGGAGTKGTAFNIKVVNNAFSREVYSKSGQYGPVAYWDAKGSGNVWSGNVFSDNGETITP